jgi:hypothetical protein
MGAGIRRRITVRISEEEPCPSFKRKRGAPMTELLIILAIAIVWFVVSHWILRRHGSTS